MRMMMIDYNYRNLRFENHLSDLTQLVWCIRINQYGRVHTRWKDSVRYGYPQVFEQLFRRGTNPLRAHNLSRCSRRQFLQQSLQNERGTSGVRVRVLMAENRQAV